jgi:hypothetical protein
VWRVSLFMSVYYVTLLDFATVKQQSQCLKCTTALVQFDYATTLYCIESNSSANNKPDLRQNLTDTDVSEAGSSIGIMIQSLTGPLVRHYPTYLEWARDTNQRCITLYPMHR